ncbi:hypothetical protein EV401DRAFT_1951037 [Pisolithus croceorrhizus]|nr:hypothetical protein EV401DRAFT_1951037 [Pisolithus croceorrhizus]
MFFTIRILMKTWESNILISITILALHATLINVCTIPVKWERRPSVLSASMPRATVPWRHVRGRTPFVVKHCTPFPTWSQSHSRVSEYINVDILSNGILINAGITGVQVNGDWAPCSCTPLPFKQVLLFRSTDGYPTFSSRSGAKPKPQLSDV